MKNIVGITEIELQRVPDHDVDTSYLEQLGFEERIGAYHRGEFGFIGIRAYCEVLTGDLSRPHVLTRHPLQSAGLWSIESDLDTRYENEVFDAERASQADDSRAFGVPETMIREALEKPDTNSSAPQNTEDAANYAPLA